MNTNMFTIAFAISYFILYFINEKDPSLISDKMIVYLSISSLLISLADFFSKASSIYAKVMSMQNERFRKYGEIIREKGYNSSRKINMCNKIINSKMYKYYFKVLPYITKMLYIIAFVLMIIWQPLKKIGIDISDNIGNSCTFLTLSIMFVTITVNNWLDEYIITFNKNNDILHMEKLKMIYEEKKDKEEYENKIV